MDAVEVRRHDRVRRSDGRRTHEAILEMAANVASVDGINGLTIGGLAAALGVSKSGLYAHFGSKEELQKETIEAARAVFAREVMAPTMEAPEGLPRLQRFLTAYFSYLERWVFPGGCFFANLLADADGRSGPIHDLVVSLERSWVEELGGLVRDAQRSGGLDGTLDADLLAFELYACLELANYHFVLFREPAVLERGRRAVDGILARAGATPA